MILNLNKRFLSTLIFILALLILLGVKHAFHYATLPAHLHQNHHSTDNPSSSSSYFSSSSTSKIKEVIVGPGVGADNDDDTNEEEEEDVGSDNAWCSRVAGQRYLDDLASMWTVSCAPLRSDTPTTTAGMNSGGLICFQAQIEEEPDNFCVAKNAVYKSDPPPAKPITAEDLFPEHGITPYGGGGDNNGGGKKNTRPMRPFKRGIGSSTPAHYSSHNRRSTSSSPWSATEKQWSLNCSPMKEWAYGVQAPYKFRTYFSETGVGQQLREFDMSVSAEAEKPKNEIAECKGSIMLVKLEGGGNIWHTLMEVWSAVLTLNVLEKAGQARKKLFGEEVGVWEEENVSVYIQENMQSEMDASPVFGLWSVVTGKEVKDAVELKDGCYKSVILPLAGGANPFWKDHWKERNCEKSSLLDRFAEKVMKFYGVEDTPAVKKDGDKVKVRIIGRQHNRKILRLFDYVKILQTTYPDADIEITKLEKLDVTEQLRMMRNTDILIGVTGAGLTHTMFLTKGAAVVELTQPEPFVYFGFGNIARMRGLEYFAVPGERRPGKSGIDWQQDNVLLDEKTFVEVMGRAIEGQKARRQTQIK